MKKEKQTALLLVLGSWVLITYVLVLNAPTAPRLALVLGMTLTALMLCGVYAIYNVYNK